MRAARLRSPREQRWTLAGMTANTPQGMYPLQGSRTPPGMYWSAAESARQCGVSRATIDRALKAGKLAAEKDEEGAWRISPHALIEAGLKPGKPSPPPVGGCPPAPGARAAVAPRCPSSSRAHRLSLGT